MYPVTDLYKQKIKENSRIFNAVIIIQHSQGALVLTDKDLSLGVLTYTESSQSGEEFTIGGTVASDISFTILNKPEYANINFMGATVICNVGLLLKEFICWSDLTSSTWNDLQSYTWSDLKRMEAEGNNTEYVPLGIFNIDDVNNQRNTIQLKAIDNMINLDKPYSLSQLSYPATLYQIYTNICNVADITVGTTTFPNMNHLVQNRPSNDLTLRDVLGYVAELAGCFAKCNRNGALELLWYKQTDTVLDPSNRFDFKASDDVIQIKGIMATVDDTTYLAGSEDYAVDLSENPLLQSDYEILLPNIFNNVKDTVFTPYTSNWQGNPAIQAGDMIVQVDKDGKEYNTLVTKSTYKYRGGSYLEAKGLPEISRGYKGSTNKKIANIVRKEIKPVGDQLNTLEQAQLNAMELMSNMLGGHLIVDKPNGIFYIADHEDISLAKKIWKYGINGYAYYPDGLESVPVTAVTADGSIVAMLVAANIITANMIQAGLLQSMDGSTWINLDDGTFNFKDMVKIVDGQLRLESPDIPDVDAIEGEINNIKNLTPGALQGGIVTISNEKVRVNHTGTNQYSELRADGFVRGYPNGEARYLSDIYVYNYITSNAWLGTGVPDPINIQLPQSFKDRGSDVDIYLAQTGWAADIGSMDTYPNLYNLTRTLETVLEVDSTDFTLDRPIVSIKNYLEQWYYRMFQGNWQSLTDYRHISFMLFVIGK